MAGLYQASVATSLASILYCLKAFNNRTTPIVLRSLRVLAAAGLKAMVGNNIASLRRASLDIAAGIKKLERFDDDDL